MIRNNYVFELPNFDTKELFKFVSKQIPDNWYMMDDDKIVCNYDSQYSWLGNRFNIYQLKKGSWPKHVDLGRSCSLNIPYHNCDETKVTRFYKSKNELKYGTVYDSFSDAKPKVNLKSNDMIGFVTSDLELDFEHVLKVPTVIRNDLPHDVINYNDDVRIIISWTCNKKFNEVLKEIEI
jgi:hypothetical protein|tara:strand:- start:7284 stop:7820 length:537 start_codon:yes stop_codon:yes gene_type:complete